MIYNICNTSMYIVDSFMAKRKVGQPKKEPTSVRSIRLPDRVWKMVSKESKEHRSVNQFILSLIEDKLIEEDKLDDSRRISPKSNSTKG